MSKLLGSDQPPRPKPLEDLANKTLDTIARLVREDWKKVYFGAVPYLDAMATLIKIEDNYMLDSGASIVNYFLANANTWKGPVARAIKAELKKRVDRFYKKAG